MTPPREKILVIKFSALGDFLLALPAMAAIRARHRDAHITLITTRPFVDIAQRSRYFDEIRAEERPQWHKVGQWWRLRRWLRAQGFSRVYDLQLNDRSAMIYKLFSPKPEWSGVVPGCSHFYANPDWRAMHAAERHREMMKQAGIEVGKADLSWMESDVSLFGLRAPYVLLVPGSSPAHPEKRWSAMRFGALGLKMMKEGYDVAVLGTAAESEVIARVVKSCPGVRDLSGRTSLYDIATLARGAKAAVGNDTGPTHLIAMAGCPTVVLFSGHSDPAKSAPVGDVIVIQAEDMNDINVPDIYGALRTMEIR